ncbi:MAG: homoserine kinase [Betaproteobacteria bacterium RIFCSPLOWO2_02_FULL_67_19]|nr:MAG: homoserine kinase [Betaproteobacteria bacterium RIFCSPLOWO2_02_FULL_67_19]
MSVYTPVSESQLAAWLKGYSIGAPCAFEPVAAGIENTNYFVTTSQGRYVLTLFERLPAAELPFYLGLMAHLARHGIPCPAPIADLADRFLSELNGKPAALVTRLPGVSLERPGAPECAELGGLLARMHLAGRSYRGYLENPRGPKWWRVAAREVRPFLDTARQRLLDEELLLQARHRFAELPRGPVHADLFRDNALFENGRISGVIDFYFAGVDCLLFDVAVCVNDWCLADHASDRRLDETRTRALLGAYAALRPISAPERAAWPVMLRAAALRFWLSRLRDFHRPRSGALVRVHDPEHFCEVLRLRAGAAAAPWPG